MSESINIKKVWWEKGSQARGKTVNPIKEFERDSQDKEAFEFLQNLYDHDYCLFFFFNTQNQKLHVFDFDFSHV